MAYTYNDYTGSYPDYGSQNQWNWFDFLYPQGSPVTTPTTPGAEDTPPAGPVPNTPLHRASGRSGGEYNYGGSQGDHPGGAGGPVTPTGITHSPYGGTNPSIFDKSGVLRAIADALDPTPNNMLSEAVQFGYSPSQYLDTKPMTVPGVGSWATQPGIAKAFLGNLPFGGALANLMGQYTANTTAMNANMAYGNQEGYGIGKFEDDYGTPRVMSLGPGLLGGYGLTGTGQFGWAAKHKIAQSLLEQSKKNAQKIAEQRTKPPGGWGGTTGNENYAGPHGSYGVDRGNSDSHDARDTRDARDHPGKNDPRGHEGGGSRVMAKGGAVTPLMAMAGRGDDNSLAHVAEGELMLPPEFQRRQPGLMRRLYAAMAEEGMDPSEYEAGNVIDVNPETGLPEYGFWKTIKKTILPAAIGAGTSYLTGSDILGGLVAGGSSKLLGADWGTALGIGALTGLGSHAFGLSGDGPGVLGSLWDSIGTSSPITGSESATAAEALNNTGGGFLGNIGGWLSDHPEQALLGGAAALGLLSGAASGGAAQEDADSDGATIDDPAYAEQVKKGWTLDRESTMPNGDFNWYTYGQLPQWSYFDKPNANAVPNMAKGGALQVSGSGNKGALSILNGALDGMGGGQDDVVPIMGAPGEHMLDADVVSAIGDGNTEEGHRRIEEMKKKIRKHKRKASASSIPPKAKSPLAYLAEVS